MLPTTRAIFANDKLVGEIKNEQILSHVMLLGKLQKVNMDIEDIEDKNKTFFIGVQWHPENMISYDKKQNNLFKNFIKSCY